MVLNGEAPVYEDAKVIINTFWYIFCYIMMIGFFTFYVVSVFRQVRHDGFTLCKLFINIILSPNTFKIYFRSSFGIYCFQMNEDGSLNEQVVRSVVQRFFSEPTAQEEAVSAWLTCEKQSKLISYLCIQIFFILLDLIKIRPILVIEI